MSKLLSNRWVNWYACHCLIKTRSQSLGEKEAGLPSLRKEEGRQEMKNFLLDGSGREVDTCWLEAVSSGGGSTMIWMIWEISNVE